MKKKKNQQKNNKQTDLLVFFAYEIMPLHLLMSITVINTCDCSHYRNRSQLIFKSKYYFVQSRPYHHGEDTVR